MSRPDLDACRPTRRNAHIWSSHLDLETTLPTLGLAAICRELQGQGVAVDDLLRSIGLAPDAPDDPTCRITIGQKLAFFDQARRRARDPAFALEAGRRHRLQDYGIFGFALTSCSTAAEALTFGLAHGRVAGNILERSFRIEGSSGILEAHDALGFGDVLPVVLEFSLAKTQRLFELVAGEPIRPKRVLLPYAAPEHHAAYRRTFDCDVVFDAGAAEWHFEVALLERRCPNASAFAHRLASQSCAELRSDLEERRPAIVQAVRACYLEGIARNRAPTADETASALRMSPRTLARRLAEAGVNYRDLTEEIRCRRAFDLLSRRGTTVDDVADLLGFSDASSFRKAFKRWYGNTPVEYRRTMIRENG
jgi:AraC-like DNA-binding protein